MMPGMPERRTHDYARNGITSLLAASGIAGGTVISALHRRHRHQELLAFLKKTDKNVPAELDVHLACDNYGTHKTPAVQAWLDRRPASTCTSPRPDRPGSTRQSAGSVPDRSDDPPRRAQERPGPRSRHPRPGRELEREPPAVRLDEEILESLARYLQKISPAADEKTKELLNKISDVGH